MHNWVTGNGRRWWLLLRKAAPGIPEACRKCVQVLRGRRRHRTPRNPATSARRAPRWSLWITTVLLLSQAAGMRRCNCKITICSDSTMHVGVGCVMWDKLQNDSSCWETSKHFPDLAKTNRGRDPRILVQSVHYAFISIYFLRELRT